MIAPGTREKRSIRPDDIERSLPGTKAIASPRIVRSAPPISTDSEKRIKNRRALAAPEREGEREREKDRRTARSGKSQIRARSDRNRCYRVIVRRAWPSNYRINYSRRGSQ